LKRISILIILILSLVSCNKSDKEKPVKKVPIVVAFGFTLNNFDVVQDTIQDGDTFGSILATQNIGDKKVYDIVEKVKA